MFPHFDFVIHFCSSGSSWNCERVNSSTGPFLSLGSSGLLVYGATLWASTSCHESFAEERCSGSFGAYHVLRLWQQLGGLRRSRARRRRKDSLHCPSHSGADFLGEHAFLICYRIEEVYCSWCSRCSLGLFFANVAGTASVFAFCNCLWNQLRKGVLFHSSVGARRSALCLDWQARVPRLYQAGRVSCTGATFGAR